MVNLIARTHSAPAPGVPFVSPDSDLPIAAAARPTRLAIQNPPKIMTPI